MSCEEVRESVDAYVDGELDLVHAMEFERHLEHCAECNVLPTSFNNCGAQSALIPLTSPPLKDLKTKGFPLTGGRLDYFGGRSVAALVYRRSQHVISLFIRPSSNSDSRLQATTINGYNAIHWTRSGMTYWAVSDLNAQDLREFVRDQQE